MAVKIGSSDISDAKLGTIQVQKMYIGSTEVWSSAPPTYPGTCDFFGDGTGWAYCTFNNTLGDSCSHLSLSSSKNYTYVSGKVGNAVQLDTAGDGDSGIYYSRSGGGDCLHFYMYSTPLTYSLWVYTPSLAQYRNPMVFVPYYLDMEATVVGGFVISDTETIFFHTEHENPVHIQIGSTGYALNKWCHLVATKPANSRTVYFYLNGVYQKNRTLSNLDYSNYGIAIGNGNSGYSDAGKIRIDNVRILNRYCTADDVQLLYNE